MKKLSLEIPEDVYAAIEEKGVQEFRNVSQQASYLLLTWAQEDKTRRQKTDKLAASTPLPHRASSLPSVSV